MNRLLLLLVATPIFLAAQLKLYVGPSSDQNAVGTVYDMGSTPAGEKIETRFQVRNTGATSVNITPMFVQGEGFTMVNKPSLPYVIAPGSNLDFTIRFQPRDYGTFSANLTLNGISVLLRGSAFAGAVVRVGDTSLTSGDTVDFGHIERGQTAVRRFEVANVSTQPVGVTRVSVSVSAFRVAGPQELPITLQPGTSLAYDVTFEPANAGPFQSFLDVNGRLFRLTGTASEPPFTRPSVELVTNVLTSAQQGKVAVRFGSPSRARGSGQLRITFTPAPGAKDNDAAIQFVSSGSRTIPFTVAEGDTYVKFGAAQETTFQSGTTAGTLTLIAEVGGYNEHLNITIAESAVKLENVTALRNGNSIELRLTGFDNTQSGSQMAFTFYGRNGQAISPGALRVDATADFKRYFDGSTLGGTFALRATFPVAGNASEIAGLEVEMKNVAGTIRSERLMF